MRHKSVIDELGRSRDEVIRRVFERNYSKTQIVQNIDFARERYPKLIIRPVGLQVMNDHSLVLIEFTPADHPDSVKIKEMRRYKLVPIAEVPQANFRSGE